MFQVFSGLNQVHRILFSPLVSGRRPGSPPGQAQTEQKVELGPVAPLTGKPEDSERVSACHEKVVLASLPHFHTLPE